MPSDFGDFFVKVWEFLRDAQNLAALGFISTGVGAVIVAGWHVYKHRSAKKSNDSGASVKIGLDEEKTARLVADAHRPLTEKLEKISDQIAEQKGIPAAPLHAVLEKLGEKGVPDHEIPTKLDEAADQLVEFRGKLAKPSNDQPELAAVREHALALIDQGDLDAARVKLSQGREAARALREEASRKEAGFLADEARIDRLQLAYRAAAEKYGAAAELVNSFDPAAEWEFLMSQASELDDFGREFADNTALASAIALYRKALELVPCEALPQQWAGTQNDLGTSLATLGEREDGTSRLDEAVTAYREALKEGTRERVPLEWAVTQNNLGNALVRLGEREGGTARLEEAIVAYREALKEGTRERVALQWATTQNNLGTALVMIGEHESSIAWLEEAIASFRGALGEFTRERVPLQWAATQNNLGNALRALGQREDGTARLEEAVSVLREALNEYARERVPLKWAGTQNNLGNALRKLGERENDTVRLEEAVLAYREALKEWTPEHAPYHWDIAQRNLKRAEELLEERKR